MLHMSSRVSPFCPCPLRMTHEYLASHSLDRIAACSCRGSQIVDQTRSASTCSSRPVSSVHRCVVSRTRTAHAGPFRDIFAAIPEPQICAPTASRIAGSLRGTDGAPIFRAAILGRAAQPSATRVCNHRWPEPRQRRQRWRGELSMYGLDFIRRWRRAKLPCLRHAFVLDPCAEAGRQPRAEMIE